jgi:hypothetical protein
MDGIAAWLRQPFKAEGTAIDWFLFFGLLIVISVIWRIILGHLRLAGD